MNICKYCKHPITPGLKISDKHICVCCMIAGDYLKAQTKLICKELANKKEEIIKEIKQMVRVYKIEIVYKVSEAFIEKWKRVKNNKNKILSERLLEKWRYEL